MSTSPTKSRPAPKIILDPNQGSFGFDFPEAMNATGPALAPVRPAVKASSQKKASAPSVRRTGPVRARISFEAPVRLKRKLERVARDLDRSKTALLREAVEGYLLSVVEKETER